MKIIVSDFDNTITKNRIIPKNNLDAIKRFTAAGNLFFVCTGRGLNHTRSIKKLPISGLLAGSGAGIEIGKQKYYTFFDDGVSKLIYQNMKKTHPFMSFANGYTMHSFIVRRFFKTMFTNERIFEGVTSMSYSFKTTKEAQDNASMIKEELGDKINCLINNNNLDIVPRGISKANACTRIKEMYGADKVYVIGDNYNDLEMIQMHKGACVAHGIEEVKKEATYIYESLSDYIDDIMSEKI